MFIIHGVSRKYGVGLHYETTNTEELKETKELKEAVKIFISHNDDFFIFKHTDEECKTVATLVNGYYAYDSGSKLPEVVIKLLKDGHKMGAPLR